MNISRELKKQEAVKRMKAWEIFPETIKQFERDDLISESVPPFGACFWIEGERLEKIRAFEEKYNALVYFVVRSHTEFGIMDSYLYVGDHEEEWEMDNADIKNGTQLCYVYNETDPDMSEFGSIGLVQTSAAGLKRVW